MQIEGKQTTFTTCVISHFTLEVLSGQQTCPRQSHHTADDMSNASAEPTRAKFSLSLGSKKPSVITRKSSAATKRPRNLLDADQDEDEGLQKNQVEISTFDSRVSNTTKHVKDARTIEPIPNRDWRAESRRKRQRHGQPTNETDLGVAKDSFPKSAQSESEGQQKGPSEPQTLEEQAIASLTGEKTGPPAATVISPPSPPPTEEEAFQNDFRSAPPAASLADYEATPVDGFGSALMRGYLKDGQTLESIAASRKAPEVKRERRKDLLGLGAKEMDLGLESAQLKGKDKGGKGRMMREAGEYNPLARVNKKTGEIIGEDELREKLEAQKKMDLREKDKETKFNQWIIRDERQDHQRDELHERNKSRSSEKQRRSKHDGHEDKPSRDYPDRSRASHRHHR